LIQSGCARQPPGHGTQFLVQVGEVTNSAETVSVTDLAATRQALDSRLNRLGAKAFIEVTNAAQLLVRVPKMSDRQLQSVRLAVSGQGLLSLRLVHPQSEDLLSRSETPAGYASMVLQSTGAGGAQVEETLMVKKRMESGFPPLIVERAYASQDPIGNYEISFELNSEAAEAFARVTREHVFERLAILFDGRLYSAPVIRGEIPGGRAMISGSFSKEEAYELAVMLETPLPSPISLLQEDSY